MATKYVELPGFDSTLEEIWEVVFRAPCGNLYIYSTNLIDQAKRKIESIRTKHPDRFEKVELNLVYREIWRK